MFEIVGLDHIVLRTTSLEKMQTFYCDVLGCQVEQIKHEFGLVQLRIGQHLIDLLKVDDMEESTRQNMDHFCLQIKPFNYKGLEQYFKKHNIEIARFGQRYGAKGQGYSFYIKDPEGNEIELTSA